MLDYQGIENRCGNLAAAIAPARDRDYESTRCALLCFAADKQFKYKNPSFISLAL